MTTVSEYYYYSWGSSGQNFLYMLLFFLLIGMGSGIKNINQREKYKQKQYINYVVPIFC